MCPKLNTIYYIEHKNHHRKCLPITSSTMDVSQTTYPIYYVGHKNSIASVFPSLGRCGCVPNYTPHLLWGHKHTSTMALPLPVYDARVPKYTPYFLYKAHKPQHKQRF